MITINNYSYPILNFFGLQALWEHPMFSTIMEKVPAETAKGEMPESMKALQDMYAEQGHSPVTWRSFEELTAKRRDAWPILALYPEDFNALGAERVMGIDSMISLLWHTYYHDAIPEVVPPEVWDESFYYKADKKFHDWFFGNEIHVKGIMIRPYEKTACLYFVHRDENMDMASSMYLMDRYLLLFHAGGAGFMSSRFVVPSGFKKLAAIRGTSLEETFFEEDIYNVLKYHHYVHVLGKGKTTLMHRGDSMSFRGSTYRSYTDTPLMFVTN